MQLHQLSLVRCCTVAVWAALSASSAFAHITLEQKSAEAGSYYKAVFRVGHGCEGAPTTSVTVFVPPGISSANPMPKPGWTLNTAKPSVGEATPTQISWSGGLLPHEHYDEFSLRLHLPKQPGPLWFRVLQQCQGGGSVDWAETPSGGTSTHGLKWPAALLELRSPEPAAPAHHQH